VAADLGGQLLPVGRASVSSLDAESFRCPEQGSPPEWMYISPESLADGVTPRARKLRGHVKGVYGVRVRPRLEPIPRKWLKACEAAEYANQRGYPEATVEMIRANVALDLLERQPDCSICACPPQRTRLALGARDQKPLPTLVCRFELRG
jgi:hypothetical protein